MTLLLFRRLFTRRTLPFWVLATMLPLLSHSHGTKAQTPPPVTLTFNSVADTYVDGGSTSSTFGTSKTLTADASPLRIIYLRFAVTGLTGRTVQHARMRLQVTTAGDGGKLHTVTSNLTWNPATVNYKTRPGYASAALATLGPVSAGAVAEWNLDGQITQDGVYDLALDTTNNAGVTFNSSRATSGLKPTLVLTVPATPPTLTLAQPADGASFFVGDMVTLQASAHDGTGVTLAGINWRSDLDGALGTGPVVTTTALRQGSHTLTAAVTDGQGLTTTATLHVTMATRPPVVNTPPLVSITAPTASQVLVAGPMLTLTGSASDLEDGDLSATLVWTSDRDGLLGAGATLSHALSQGPHTLTATVTDHGGLQATATVSVQVLAAVTVEFPALADVHVDSSTPSNNFGTSPVLRVDANAVRNSYLRFTVTGIGTRNVVQAQLRMAVDGVLGAESDSGGTVIPITDGTWQEGTLTYATRPLLDGAPLATLGPVTAGQTVNFDVTRAVTADGTYNFALVSSSPDEVTYRSREGGPAPTLVVVLAGNPPVVTISAPPTGTVAFVNDALTFTAAANDSDDGDLSAGIQWSSSRDGALGTGPTITTTALSAGLHTITAAATDHDGLTGQGMITVRVRTPNTPPTVTITAPASGGSVPFGTAVPLAATSSDDFDGDLTSRLQWSSSRDGALGTGGSFTVPRLSVGTHTLTAAVTDSDHATGAAQITFTVTPTPPVVSISAPLDGTRVFAGTPLTFTGNATDAVDGNLSPALRWFSDRDGLLGTGASFTKSTLSLGTHAITAQATNHSGVSAQATRTIVIRPPNVPPTLTIVAPASNSAVLTGKPMLVAALATDAEDGDLSPSVRWTSSRDGSLGTGTHAVPSLSVGTHTLTATVTDRDGTTVTATATVTVSPITLTFPVVADTYVDNATPTKAFGTTTSGLAGNAPVRQAFLRFALSGIGSFRVQQAQLRLQAGSASADATTASTTVSTLTNITWPEATVTYNTRPTIDGAVVGTVGAVKANQVIVTDVTPAVTRDGALSLALTSTSSDWVRFLSRESGTAKAPLLTVTLTQNLAPVVTITAPASGTKVLPGQAVTFTATATDAENGDLSPQLTWSSDRDGTLGTGATLTVSSLHSGMHTITARVTDVGGVSGQAQITLAVANAPMVTILAPANGAGFLAADLSTHPVMFSARATDLEDGDVSQSLEWRSDRDGALASGASISASQLSLGTHVITATATDDDGLHGQAQITIRIREPNQAPVVTITAPANAGATPAGTPVTLGATVTDDFDTGLASQVRWSSSRDGAIGTGAPLTATLREGTHTLTATVTDSNGASASASIGFTVTPTAPVVTIAAPAVGTRVFTGTAVTFTGTAQDATDGTLTAALRWTSDRDGLIGSGGTFSTARLSLGTHLIRAAVTDAGGLEGSAARTIVIRPPNTPPVVTIISPNDGGALLTGNRVVLGALALDSDDGDVSATTHWSSSRDGNLGTGAAVVVPSLSVGIHTLTAIATDRDGASAVASITVTVSPATLTFAPSADTYIDSGAATSRFGTTTSMLIGSGPTRQALLRFPVTGIGHFTIQQALLRLTAGPASADGSVVGGSVQTLTNNTWSEATTTYATRPAIDGPVVATRAAKIAANQVVDYDVTTAITGDNTYNFAIVTTSPDFFRFMSRENSSGKPALIVTLTHNTKPVVTITAPAVGTRVMPGTAVAFAATATDAESGDLSSRISWRSDRDGLLGTGPALTVSTLSPGAHTVTAEAVDPEGLVGHAEISFYVAQPPVVAITTPPDGSVFYVTDLPITLAAVATDPEDGDLSAHLDWKSDLDGPLASGPSVVARTLRIGTHIITTGVTDSDGLRGEARVTIRVRGPNAAPTLQITSPLDGGSIPAGTPVALRANATDDFDGDLSGQVRWTSDRDGALGTGVPRTLILTEGSHTITASVTDSDAAATTAQIHFTVSPTPPVITITSPVQGIRVFAGTTLTFSGTALDATDGTLSAGLRWTSDRDGLIGSGPSFTTSRLSAGTHTITASASDLGGLVGQAVRSITIRTPNLPPVITMLAPVDGSALLAGKPVVLAGTAVDPEDGDLAAGIHWTSSRDGNLGMGPTVLLPSLSLGTHTISASVTDRDGATSIASATITIVQATMTLTAIADTYVDAGVPTRVFGTASDLLAGTAPVRQIFYRFSVTGLGNLGVQQALLRLTVGAAKTDPATVAGTINAITSNAWSETATTYNTRPAIDGPVLAARPSKVIAKQVVDFDVSAGVTGDGVYNFALTSTSSDWVGYNSREASSGKPQLVLTLKENTNPVVNITAPTNGTVINIGAPVTLNGTAIDAETGNLASQIQWSSDRDGALGTGATVTVPRLSPGAHVITASVTDATGLSGSAQITLQVGHKPQVTISAPRPLQVFFNYQFPITLTGTAMDVEDGNLSQRLQWSSDRDGALGVGPSVRVSSLTLGTHVLAAVVTDANGERAQVQVTIRVRGPNQPATLRITSPADGAQIPAGTQTSLVASAIDDFDGDISSLVRWRSDRDGDLPMGAPTVVLHTEGAHVLTATVTDSDGVSSTASIGVTITPTPPVVTITAPATGTTMVQDVSLSFAASALDATDGDLSSTLQWTSNRDGAIGTGAGFALTTLSEGTHTITATTQDTGGLVGSTSITLQVIRQPVVTILLPAPGDLFLTTTTVKLLATAVDRVDGDVSNTLTWTSDRDGVIGHGATFTTSSLSVGTHTVTARALNSQGHAGTATVAFTMQVGSISFEPVADTYVDQALATTIFGTAPDLHVVGSPTTRQSFLRFAVTGVGSFPVDHATLRLTVGSTSTSDGGDGGTINLISDNTWSEAATKWSNRPAVDGPVLDTHSQPVAQSQGVDYAVTPAITGDGSYNFALTSGTSNAPKFDSREGVHHPLLTIYFRQPDTRKLPTVVITTPADNTTMFDDQGLALTGTASDNHDGDLTAGLMWKSSLDGTLGTGPTVNVAHLSRGTHTISASARNSINLTGTAAVTLMVTDRPPAVAITAPADGRVFAIGFPVTFTATASHAGDGDLGATVVWTSDRDGQFGTGRTFTTAALSPGDHLITATATDALGTTGRASITIAIGNASPRISISAPAAATSVTEGTTVAFAATATDLEDGDLTPSIAWTSDVQGTLGTGGSLSLVLNTGTHHVTASATDSSGVTRTAQVTVTVTASPPTLTILSPADGSSTSGSVSFTGQAIDYRDGDRSAQIRWTSDVAGPLGTGATVVAPHLAAGRHIVTATVTDTDGLTATKTVTIAIGYTPPTVTITGPAPGASVAAGQPITFTGTATDGLDGTITASIKWFSNLNGQIGTGGAVTTSTLARGTHTITARVTDSKGLSATAQVVVNITASAGSANNNPPQVTIATPASGAQLAAGSPVTFTATAIDEAGDISASLAWVSNLDGVIGNGRSFTLSTLSPGTHRITASVSDSGGLVGSASVTVTISASAQVFSVVADTYTDNSTANAGTNFGSQPFLRLQNSPVLRVFLRFNVTGLPAGPIPHAVVRMQTTASTNSGALYTTGSGAEMHVVATPGTATLPGGWDELLVNSLNKPVIDQAIVSTIETTVNPSQTVDWDVTSILAAGNGTYEFGLKTLSTDRAEFVSREGGVGAPQLVVFRDAPAATNPTVHITTPSEGAILTPGVATSFTATATDPQDGNLAASVLWRSDKDGILGIGPQITPTLSPGLHVITATATDSTHISAADLIHVSVGSGAPALTIIAPSNGSSVALGAPMPLIATAFDTRDGDLSFSIAWTSSLDGPLGTGASFVRTLSAGVHTLTATVTDSDHNTVSALATVTVDASRVGYEDFAYGPNIDVALDHATATKQQSKLWVQDGIWWGVLFNAARGEYHIYRMDIPTQTWVDTGVFVDERGKSRADCLLDGNKLYIVSRYGFDGASPPNDRVMRYTYFPGAQVYAMDPGFPVNLGPTNAEGFTIAKDSLGKLWISYVQNGTVFTRHTLTSDTDWGQPFQVPAAEGNPATANDDSATIAMPSGQIGIYWGNQASSKCYFALHTDGMSDTDPAAWKFEIAAAGSAIADDHTNMKLASDGRLFVVQKTSRTTPGQTLVGLLVRSTAGVWTPLIKVANVDVDPTRPSMALDEVNRKVYVFYSSFFSDIYYKVSDMDAPVFDGASIGIPLMKSGTTPISPSLGGPGGINNPAGMKQNPDPSTGLLMIASTTETNRYWHNWVYLPQPKPMVTISAPANGLRIRSGAPVTFTATASSGVDGDVTAALKWNSSRDGQFGTGGTVTTSTLSRGVHQITASATDSTRLTGTAQLTITIEQDVGPVVTITAPTAGQKVRSDRTVSFTGTALDSFDGDRTSTLVWTSNRDGQIGTGGLCSPSLSLGNHTITARATDAGGLVGTATLNIVVANATVPTLTVTNPPDGKLYAFGASVPFAATASDTFDGDVTSHIVWTSDRDGGVGTGGSFTRSSLTRGVHHLTASVSDTNGFITNAARTVTIVDDAPPVISITAPTRMVVAAGKPVTFTATATDQLDGDRTSTLVWTSNRDGQIGTGGTVTTSSLTVGTHTITAAATDAAGLSGTAQLTLEIRVQPAPTVAITAPAEGTSALFADDVTLTGTATDTIDGDIASSIRWSSNRDGVLGTGAQLVVHSLSIGQHTITASALNSGNLTGTAIIHLSIASGPQVVILAPADATTAIAGDLLTFTGLAFDFEDGDISSALGWSSNLDGALGTGSSITVTLSRGVHTITATSTDHDGHTARRSIGVEVIAKPTVIIATPANNALFGFGQAISFSAFATDPVDGNVSAQVTWSSNLDGTLGTGGSLTVSSLRSGTHIITASVTNHRGLTGQKQVTLVVNDPPTLTILSPANNTTFGQGNAVSLSATATDREDGNLSAAVTWTSSRDGALGTGPLSISTLSPGSHTITATVTDSTGRTAQASRAIVISGRPSVTVSAPMDGLRIQLGAAVTFTGTATDIEDGSLTSAITWTSLRDGLLGTGSSITVSTLSAGTHTIVAAATDHDGLTGQKQITVIVNAPPVLSIIAPPTGTTFERGATVTLGAIATDAEDGNIAANVHWSSNLDGALGTGGSLSISTLRSGAHTITATVADSTGRQVQASISIFINGSPMVVITTPAHGSVFSPAAPILFTATATDPEDGDLSGAISWSSNLDGALGNGGSITVNTLHSGTHTITALVTDTSGRQTSSQITVVINAAPVVTITTPANNASFARGATIAFTATATDTEDGNLASAIGWSSNLDGLLGSGASLSTGVLRSGTHTITASVTDRGGRSNTTQITVIVRPAPTITITAPASGSVYSPTDTIHLTGLAMDADDVSLSTTISWSDGGTVLGTGASLNVTGLASGSHTITAGITDAGGRPITTSIIVVINAAPMVSITAPASGSVFSPGDTIHVTGAATDLEDGGISFNIRWTEGATTLGTGSAIDVIGLASGSHVLTASITDAGGKTATASITVVVNAAPTVTISAPASGSMYNPGDTIHLAGSASDLENGNLSASIVWTMGATTLGTGATLDVSSLTSGSHVLTATVTDAGGRSATASITVSVDLAPTVSITAPANGTVFSPGDTIHLAGSATDAEDGNLSASIVWTKGVTTLGTGATLDVSSLTSGSHVLTATITDALGKSATASITVSVNAAPTVAITGPANGAVYSPGDLIAFAGTASDLEDGPLSTSIVWTSGASTLGTGATVSTSAFTSGSHLVTATVTDAGGKTATASITVFVNAAPTVAISAPADGTVYSPGDTVHLAGTASDLEDGGLSASIVWTEGASTLGTGATVDVTGLASGNHVLTATVTDAGSKTASAHITVVVNAAPTVSITAPANGSLHQAGAAIHFTGTATDLEDGNVSASIVWTEGASTLGTGAALDVSTLPAGSHVITATITDAGGKTATAQISVVVNAAPIVTITAPADGSVSQVGANIHLTANATDAEDGDLSAGIVWTTGASTLGTGATVDVSTLPAGSHVIIATITDAGGKTVSTQIAVIVNAQPTVIINLPPSGTSFTAGTLVTFTGTASDPEDGTLDANIHWFSTLNGALGTGASVSTSSLSVGTHTIIALISDSRGGNGTAAISVEVH